MPRISVLMPVYKTKEEYLKPAIESILSQTYTDFEFIILDDCPQDTKCEKIIKSYNDKRIRYYRNDKNLGISGARNKLLDLACGEYLAIMDHDDISLSDRFSKQVKFLDENPQYGVVGSWHGFVDRDEIYKRPITNHQIKSMLKNSISCPLHHPTCMLRKSILTDNYIGYESSFSPAEDYVLWLRLSKVTKMYNLPENLFLYRDFDNTTAQTHNHIIMACKMARSLIYNTSENLIDQINTGSLLNCLWKRLFSYRKENRGRYKYRKIVFMGIKLTLKKKIIKSQNVDGDKKQSSLMRKLISSSYVPLCYKNYFYYYRGLPIYANGCRLYSDQYVLPKTAILIQGGILAKHQFTLETVKFYKQIFNTPNVLIILSTWTDEVENLDEFEKHGVTIVTSTKPTNNGRGNINLQIESTREGLKAAKELGCKYVLKTRTDQRLYATNILEMLFNLQKTFPLSNEEKGLKKRLIALSFNTFKYRIYGVSDMFMFGHIKDMLKYWDMPEDTFSPASLEGKDEVEIFQKHCPETLIAANFLKQIHHKCDFSIKDTFRCYAKYFCFIDKEMIKMFWPKYSNCNCRWEKFEPHVMEEMSFRDWLNLYYRNGCHEEAAQRHFVSLPKLSF